MKNCEILENSRQMLEQYKSLIPISDKGFVEEALL
jgi:hypothetical protein